MSAHDTPERGLAAVHGQMAAAVADELREIERRGVRDTVDVSAGILVDESPQHWHYRFEVKGRTGALRVGREVGLDTGEDVFVGTVVRRRGAHVVLAFDQSLGAETAPGRLVADSRWLLLALRRRLQDIDGLVRTNDRQFFHAAALRVVGARATTTESNSFTCKSTELNPEQQRLVERGHEAELLVLFGPAGTGKTHGLIHLIDSLIGHGNRVAYLASTNLAVDGLLDRAAPLFLHRPWWRDGAVIRVGPADSVSLTRENHEQFSLDAVLQRHTDVDLLSHAQYRRLAENLVHSACLTAATVHQSYLSPLLTQGGWDVLIVDEVSMVNPAILFTAAGLARRTIIAGDFRQLPPIAHSRSNAARHWLRTDPFHVLGIPQEIERGGHPRPLLMLREQYRMAEDIAAVVQPAYYHQLVTHETVRHRPVGPLGPHGVFVVDTSALKARALVTAAGSRYNDVHAQVASDVLASALARGSLDAAAVSEVLVIAPFVAQVRLLTESLGDRFGRSAPSVRTIHRAQGCEADVVLLDLTDASNLPVSRFFKGRGFSSESARLLTVAVTRARQHLIVIGDMPHMRSRGVGIVVRKMMEAISSGRHMDAERILRSSAA